MENKPIKVGEVLILEDSKEFVVLETVELEGNKYLLMANIEDDEDIVIRKENLVENSIDGIDTEEEFTKATIAFANAMNVFNDAK